MFKIDFKKLLVLMMPTFMRKERILGIMRAFIWPLISLSNLREEWQEDTLFRLHHTGQVCYLKDALNKAFGRTYKDGFEIKDSIQEGQYLLIYKEGDNSMGRHLLVGNTTLYREDSIMAKTNFLVEYPANLATEDIIKVKAIVENYRLVSCTPSYQEKSIH